MLPTVPWVTHLQPHTASSVSTSGAALLTGEQMCPGDPCGAAGPAPHAGLALSALAERWCCKNCLTRLAVALVLGGNLYLVTSVRILLVHLVMLAGIERPLL